MKINSKIRKKRRLLFVNGSLNVGGIERSLLNVLTNLDDDIYDVDLLLLNGKGAYSDQLPPFVNVLYRDNSHVYGPFLSVFYDNLCHMRIKDIVFRMVTMLYPKVGGWILKALRPLLSLENTYDYAIAFRMGFANDIVSFVVKAKSKICWWHQGECNYTTKQIQTISKKWKRIDTIASVSVECKKIICKRFNVSDKKVIVVPNFVDNTIISQQAVEKDPYPKDHYIKIISLGVFFNRKHFEDIPDIAAYLLSCGINLFKWYIIGDGAKYSEISDKIKGNKLENNVFLVGEKSNPYPYLKYADIMVHTSYVESQCLAILEAMVLKTPCVITKTTIPLDYPIDGVNCLLAEQNVQSQAECLIRMTTGKVDTEKLTENAYRMVVKEYSKSNIIPRIDQLFR